MRKVPPGIQAIESVTAAWASTLRGTSAHLAAGGGLMDPGDRVLVCLTHSGSDALIPGVYVRLADGGCRPRDVELPARQRARRHDHELAADGHQRLGVSEQDLGERGAKIVVS